MNPIVVDAARRFIERAAATGNIGQVDNEDALNKLNVEMGQRIPEWLIQLNSTHSLCGLEIDWRVADLDGLIEWANVNGIRSESVECYPGIAILKRGFVNIGSDPYGSGDSYFIPTDSGDDPPVYQVYHDVSDEADEILSRGVLEVSPSLSNLFDNANGVSQ